MAPQAECWVLDTRRLIHYTYILTNITNTEVAEEGQWPHRLRACSVIRLGS